MNKLTAGIGSFALIAGSAFFVASSYAPSATAEARSAVAAAQSQSLGDWVWSYTDWQRGEEPPTHLFGPEVQWGERQERTATETETIPGEPSQWWNFEPTSPGTFVGEPGPPPYGEPLGKWILHGEIPPGHAGENGLYKQGGGSGSWFYRINATEPQTVEHTFTEYRWLVGVPLEEPGHGGENGNGGENGRGTAPADPTPTDPAQPDDARDADAENATPPGQSQPENDGAPSVTKPDFPTVIDAGR